MLCQHIAYREISPRRSSRIVSMFNRDYSGLKVMSRTATWPCLTWPSQQVNPVAVSPAPGDIHASFHLIRCSLLFHRLRAPRTCLFSSCAIERAMFVLTAAVFKAWMTGTYEALQYSNRYVVGWIQCGNTTSTKHFDKSTRVLRYSSAVDGLGDSESREGQEPAGEATGNIDRPNACVRYRRW